jgi:hypothetical protein
MIRDSPESKLPGNLSDVQYSGFCYDRFRDPKEDSGFRPGEGGPYIIVPVDQLVAIESLLTRDRVSYWVDSYAISLDGKPGITFVTLGRGTDAKHIQNLLDEV